MGVVECWSMGAGWGGSQGRRGQCSSASGGSMGIVRHLVAIKVESDLEAPSVSPIAKCVDSSAAVPGHGRNDLTPYSEDQQCVP